MAMATGLWCGDTRAQSVCNPADDGAIIEALARLRSAVDPCGESAQIAGVLEELERCTPGGYRICASTVAARNVFDRPTGGDVAVGTVTWNPELRTELEGAAAGDPNSAVRRDPTASLLHELVHVTQECAGLNPGEHELEAVRIENIYRRATGLQQRTRYGDIRLPAEMVRLCTAAHCSCSVPVLRQAQDERSLGIASIRPEPVEEHGRSATHGAEVDPLSVAAEVRGAGAADRGRVGDGGVTEHARPPGGHHADR